MSDRRRRPETYWNDKEEKRAPDISPGRSQNWSKAEAHDDMMHGNYSRSPSRDRPKYDDVSRDRSRMYSHPTHDGWEQQYSTRPSVDSYGPSYRSRDKGAGGDMRMSRERDRTWSPNRSRSRSRDRMSRSSRENPRGPRHEINASYPNTRNDSKDFDSRGGGNNNITESWTRRPDHKGDSRYSDNRSTRVPCRYFAAGNCNRDDCRFSHDVPDSVRDYDDNHNLGNRNRTSHNDRDPHSSHSPRGRHDDRNAGSSFSHMEKKKHWNSSVWDHVDSGSFNETLDDNDNKNNNNNNNNNSNNNNSYNNTRDSRDEKKMKKWDGPLWDELSVVKTDDNKSRKWDDQGLAENVVNETDLNNMVSENVNQQSHMLSANPFNEPLNGQGYVHRETQNKETSLTSQPGQGYVHMETQNKEASLTSQPGQGYVHMETQNKEASLTSQPGQGYVHMETQSKEASLTSQPGQGYVHMETQNKEASLTSQPAPQPNVVPETSHKGQISQMYSESNLTSAIDYLKSLPNSAYNVTRANEEQNLVVKISQPVDVMKKESVETIDKMVADNYKKEEENNITNADDAATHDKIDEGDSGNDEKAMRQFKVSLADFVKEILKPKWKEGKMSRDVHKTVVKKVVEKVSSSIHGSQIPKTQPKIDQYLAYCKPKITKLVEAYMERHVKS